MPRTVGVVLLSVSIADSQSEHCNIDNRFCFAFGAKQRVLYQYSILIHFGMRPVFTNRAGKPTELLLNGLSHINLRSITALRLASGFCDCSIPQIETIMDRNTFLLAINCTYNTADRQALPVQDAVTFYHALSTQTTSKTRYPAPAARASRSL